MCVCSRLFLFAENGLKISDFSIIPGEVQIIDVVLTNDLPVSGVQFNLNLPNGLSIVRNEDNENIHSLFLSNRNNSDFVILGKTNDDIIRVLAFSPTAQCFDGKDGVIIRIALVVNSDYLYNDQIFVSDIAYSVITNDRLVHTVIQSPFYVKVKINESEPQMPHLADDSVGNEELYDDRGVRISSSQVGRMYISKKRKKTFAVK